MFFSRTVTVTQTRIQLYEAGSLCTNLWWRYDAEGALCHWSRTRFGRSAAVQCGTSWPSPAVAASSSCAARSSGNANDAAGIPKAEQISAELCWPWQSLSGSFVAVILRQPAARRRYIVCPRAGPGPETQSHAAGRAAVTPFYGPGPGRLRLTGVSAGGPGRREAEGSGQSDRDQPARRRGRRLGAAAARDSPRFWQSAVGWAARPPPLFASPGQCCRSGWNPLEPAAVRRESKRPGRSSRLNAPCHWCCVRIATVAPVSNCKFEEIQATSTYNYYCIEYCASLLHEWAPRSTIKTKAIFQCWSIIHLISHCFWLRHDAPLLFLMTWCTFTLFVC